MEIDTYYDVLSYYTYTSDLWKWYCNILWNYRLIILSKTRQESQAPWLQIASRLMQIMLNTFNKHVKDWGKSLLGFQGWGKLYRALKEV